MEKVEASRLRAALGDAYNAITMVERLKAGGEFFMTGQENAEALARWEEHLEAALDAVTEELAARNRPMALRDHIEEYRSILHEVLGAWYTKESPGVQRLASILAQPPAPRPETGGDASWVDPIVFYKHLEAWAWSGRFAPGETVLEDIKHRDAALLASQGQGEASDEVIAALEEAKRRALGVHGHSAIDKINEAIKLAYPQPATGLREAEAAYNHAEVFHTRLVAAQEALEAYPAVVTEIINGYGIIVNEDQVRPYLAEKLAQHIARAALAQAEREGE